jgi:hypothetical protein
MEPFTYFLKKWFEETIETRMSSGSQAPERIEAPSINPKVHENREIIVQALPLTRYTRERPSESEEKKKEES